MMTAPAENAGRPAQPPPPPEQEEDQNLKLGAKAIRLAANLVDWTEEYGRHGLYPSLDFQQAQPSSGGQTLQGGVAALRAAARLFLRETRHLAVAPAEQSLPEEPELSSQEQEQP